MKKKKKQDRKKWIISITLLTFVISLIFSTISELLIPNLNIIFGLLIVIIFILLGVLFDMIGVAVTSCDESPFHAQSSKKIKSAKTAVKLLKSRDRVSSFCNDVIGDICGILSGSAGVAITSILANKYSFDFTITTLLITSFIAAFTIGGKALGKSIAIKKNVQIVSFFSKILSIFF